MNKKTINKVISKKISEWISSVEDSELRSLLEKNVIVTGGAIVSMLLGEDVKDFDIYFKDKDTTLRVANYYLAKWKETHGNEDFEILDEDGRIKVLIQSSGVAGEMPEETEHFEDPFDVSEDLKEEKKKYRPVFFSQNAITLSDKIQIVLRFYGDPSEIHKNYDFIHCTNYWTKSESVILNQKALEAILNKELIYSGSLYPVCSMIRSRKFIKRGWSINAGQYLKMAFQISELDLKCVKTLEDQLTGVDSAYFSIVINALKEVDKDISASYVVEIIDRIF